MRALTLWQPWAYAITHLGKRVENRSWPPPPAAFQGPIALHAGKRYEADAFGELGRELDQVVDLDEVYRGGIVGTCRIVDVVRSPDDLPVGQRRWWVGPVGWVLDDVRVLEPIPCRGWQGLWTVDEALRLTVLGALEEG